MPRPIWSGAITFGLVNVPVKLISATDRKNVGFREIRRDDNSRIRRRKVAAADGDEVPNDQIVKGYEVGPDRFVVLEPEELRALDPVSSRTIEIEDFVELASIEPIHFDASYYLLPAETAGKPYELLRRAMLETGRAGVARFVMRTKQYLAVVRPIGPALALTTMLYHDEVVAPEALESLPTDVEPTERELTMAVSLVDSLTSDWEPERYEDTHRQRVLELIERKAQGEEIVAVADEQGPPAEVVDLVAALEASLEAAGEDRPASAS